MSRRPFELLAYGSALAALVVVGIMTLSGPAAAQSPASVNRLDEAAFSYWAGERERPDILPPVEEWTGDVSACDADHNPPEWMTRFGGFCQQIAVPAKRSLLYTGANLIFGFKG